MVEHIHGKDEVPGSIPGFGSDKFLNLLTRRLIRVIIHLEFFERLSFLGGAYYFKKKNMVRKKQKLIKKANKLIIMLVLFSLPYFSAQASEKTEALQKSIIQLVNEERIRLGLNDLKENVLLNQAAQLKAQDMINENYFSHTSPKGVDPWFWFDKVGYRYKFAGENLAMDFGTASSVHRAWMKSPTHKENIISVKFSEIGVAVLEGMIDGRETLVAVQLFGTASMENSNEVLIKDFLKSEGLILSVKESSVFPWKNSAGKNEALIFAEVTGKVSSVKAIINGQGYSLEKIRENNYLGLVSLENWNPEKDQIVIKATSPLGWEISELILQKKYYGYFQEKREEQKKISQEQENILAAGKTTENKNNSFFPWKKIQDWTMVFGTLVFLLMVGNIWILEKEEERLILNKCV